MYELHNKECLEHMHSMPAQSVDAILTDLPYGTTACAWDTVIPFEPMWEAVKHVLKPDGVFVTAARQPFSSLLIVSNLKWFRYEWVWNKLAGLGIHAKERPINIHENILVFSCKKPVYHPVMEKRKHFRPLPKTWGTALMDMSTCSRDLKHHKSGLKYPVSVFEYSGRGAELNSCNRIHPTQKPVALYKYLVQTYTNEGDTVLDMCMGSGTTGVACIETGRNFIGCETEEEHFLTAQERLDRVSRQGQLFTAASSANKHSQHDQNHNQRTIFDTLKN